MIVGGFDEVMRRNWNTGRIEMPSAVWWFLGGITLILLTCAYSGMLAFARYFDCDPLDSKLALAKDQILPSLSSGLNSMAAVVLEDFWKPFFRTLSHKETQILIRAVVVSALTGGVIGLSSAWWVAAQAQLAQARGALRFEEKPRFIHNCTYSISYFWYTAFGCIVTIIVACLVNIIPRDKKAKSSNELRLYAPFLRKWIAKKYQIKVSSTDVELNKR
ncbi:hypothetical protein MSG28_010853 [Choristoneura fumiferana]|uniref:Uncharacterized protein n=1 Tax=Choristoneura fumiferana TaxID=7141 RepID=A0ACC0KPK6_CHOFU|nr:hypothetical protein MSG28_010853 [Choristoneura fumiferana]